MYLLQFLLCLILVVGYSSGDQMLHPPGYPRPSQNSDEKDIRRMTIQPWALFNNASMRPSGPTEQETGNPGSDSGPGNSGNNGPPGPSSSTSAGQCMYLDKKYENGNFVPTPDSRCRDGCTCKNGKLDCIVDVCADDVIVSECRGWHYGNECKLCTCNNNTKKQKCVTISENCVSEKDIYEFRKVNCNPGETYTDGCRSCTCGLTGKTAFCTWEKCDQNDPSKGTLPGPCEPNKKFTSGCNQCACSADGKIANCIAGIC